MRALIRRLLYDQSAVTSLEYGLIAAVLVVAVAVGFAGMAESLSSQFNTIGLSL
jgi:Flp pilus assembly pilin Flp